MPNFMHESNIEMLVLKEGVQGKILALTLSADFFQSISQANAAELEMTDFVARNSAYEGQYEKWWGKLQEERSQLLNLHEDLMSHAITFPSVAICRHVAGIIREVESIVAL